MRLARNNEWPIGEFILIRDILDSDAYADIKDRFIGKIAKVVENTKVTFSESIDSGDQHHRIGTGWVFYYIEADILDNRDGNWTW